jgi:hypothetical protein
MEKSPFPETFGPYLSIMDTHMIRRILGTVFCEALFLSW